MTAGLLLIAGLAILSGAPASAPGEVVAQTEPASPNRQTPRLRHEFDQAMDQMALLNWRGLSAGIQILQAIIREDPDSRTEYPAKARAELSDLRKVLLKSADKSESRLDWCTAADSLWTAMDIEPSEVVRAQWHNAVFECAKASLKLDSLVVGGDFGPPDEGKDRTRLPQDPL